MNPGAAEPQAAADESAIIARILDGDTDAFSALVGRYRDRVYRIGMSFFRNAADAEDFAQEVFVKAYRGLASFKGRSLFSTWLQRIAWNTAVNQKRRSREAVLLPEDLELPGPPGVDVDHERAEDARAVREAVESLPPKQSLCVALFFYEGLSYPEISASTGLPVNTIKSHVFRAKRLLRERLGEVAAVRTGGEVRDAL